MLQGSKNFDDQALSGRIKNMDSKIIVTNPVSCTWRVSGDLDIS